MSTWETPAPRGPPTPFLAAAARRAPELLAALAGFAWFLSLGGHRALAPTSFDWLGHGDRAQHVLGWLFFRRSGWALPLGRIDGFVWPSGTTVGFTDANPLLALPGKVLSPLLPLDFQYVGPWLAACFGLQGWVGARLAALGSDRPAHRLLGGTLFVLAPPLLARLGHDTLCAHAGVLAMLLLNLLPAADAVAARRRLRVGGALVLALGAVHPYLSLMALSLALALLARLAGVDRLLSRRTAAAWAAGLLAGPAALFALLGYFGAPSHGGGFGQFSTDLLALVNPQGASSIVPSLPVADGQWEGNAYLGLGGLALSTAAVALALRRWRPAPRRLLALVPLLAACALLLAIALTNEVRAGGRVVLDLRWLYRPVVGAFGPFRSSGRFAWPAYYLLLTGAVAGTLSLLRHRPRLATGLVAAAVLLQLAELAPRAVASEFQGRPWRPRDPAWLLARGRYDHMALVPPHIMGVWGGWGHPCRGLVYGDDGYWIPLAYEAYALALTVNSGYVARGSGQRIEQACVEIERELQAGNLRDRTLYVAHPSELPALLRAGARCGRIDGYAVCVQPAAGDPFAAALAPLDPEAPPAPRGR